MSSQRMLRSILTFAPAMKTVPTSKLIPAFAGMTSQLWVAWCGCVTCPRDRSSLRNARCRTRLIEHQKRRAHDQRKCRVVVPLQRLAQIPDRETGEHHQGQDFLDGLQLHHRIHLAAHAVGRHHQQVFEEGDAPADQDGQEQGRVFVFQVPVPGVPDPK